VLVNIKEETLCLSCGEGRKKRTSTFGCAEKVGLYYQLRKRFPPSLRGGKKRKKGSTILPKTNQREYSSYNYRRKKKKGESLTPPTMGNHHSEAFSLSKGA